MKPLRLALSPMIGLMALCLASVLPANAEVSPMSIRTLKQLLRPDAAFPTQNTPLHAPDLAFHEWAWQAYVWATALDRQGVPRFMRLPTEDDLLSSDPGRWTEYARPLKLGARSIVAVGDEGYTEGAGAFVEADGNILIAPNGYPVYASVHMNPSYLATAKQNLIVDGGYTNQPADSSFNVGAAVFKATWLRLDPGQKPPWDAFTTMAQVPVLAEVQMDGTNYIAPTTNFVTVRVALVGLHVVGCTINHPEFVWAIFEHFLNSPEVADNQFDTNQSSPQDFTFYAAHTTFANANLAAYPPQLTFDPVTQRFSPVNNVVLENKTGGESQTGQANIAAVNNLGHAFLRFLRAGQSKFANYNLIGTVWLGANSYNTNSTQINALGSVNLANSTAETYEQYPVSTDKANVSNCFLCHNPQSYSTQAMVPSTLPTRLIGLSHVLGIGTPYAVPNLISGPAAD